MTRCAWPAADARAVPPLQNGEIHVWLAELPAQPQTDVSLLSEQERTRAAAFRFDHHRSSYIFHHTALRRLLGGYLGRPPESLDFRYGEKGKPELAPPWQGLHFNLSHSGGAGLYGFSRSTRLGVDIEHIRPVTYAAEIAERYLKEPAGDDFLRLWTRREAAVKAAGIGLAGLEREPEGVRQVELPALEGYSVALAVADEGLFSLLTYRFVKFS